MTVQVSAFVRSLIDHRTPDCARGHAQCYHSRILDTPSTIAAFQPPYDCRFSARNAVRVLCADEAEGHAPD